MEYNVFNPPIRPKTSAQQVKVREKLNEFGDGYEQNILDGINAVRIESLTLTWPILTTAQFSQIETFLRANAGKPFKWAMHGSTLKLWRCSEWSMSYESGVSKGLTATLREVFV